MRKLRVRTPKNGGGKSKVVDNRYATICECIPTEYYAKNHIVTVNEMVHSWNESYGKGLSVLSHSPEILNLFPPAKHEYYLADNQKFNTLDEVEVYAKSKGLRVTLMQTKINSNIYLVTLTK